MGRGAQAVSARTYYVLLVAYCPSLPRSEYEPLFLWLREETFSATDAMAAACTRAVASARIDGYPPCDREIIVAAVELEKPLAPECQGSWFPNYGHLTLSDRWPERRPPTSEESTT